MDIDAYAKYYWVQEFAKNPDAKSFSSIYFSWVKNNLIQMDPVWDFDLAFGGHSIEEINRSDQWHIKNGYWHYYLFKDSLINHRQIDFWEKIGLVFSK